MGLLKRSLPGHLKGTAIAVMVSDELMDATTQMASLYPFMKQLVTSGSYNVTNGDGKTEKHKVNLLNSAERYYVANEIVTRLEAINTDLVAAGLADTDLLLGRPMVRSRSRRMGNGHVRKGDCRRSYLGVEVSLMSLHHPISKSLNH
jgi:predicted metalloprotease with PDZ domain